MMRRCLSTVSLLAVLVLSVASPTPGKGASDGARSFARGEIAYGNGQYDKAEALLMGRFQRDDATAQLSQPSEVVSELMSLVFRVQKFFNANAVLIAFSTFLLLVLVILLSIRLRQSEMTTMFKIGCRRRTMASLICGELFIIFVCAAGLVTVLSLTVNFYATEIVQTLLVNR